MCYACMLCECVYCVWLYGCCMCVLCVLCGCEYECGCVGVHPESQGQIQSFLLNGVVQKKWHEF